MKAKRFLGTLALGALLGGVLGLFFSPGTGKKNREKFKKLTKEVSEKLVNDLSKVRNITKKEYDAIVENIIKKYSKEQLLSPAAWEKIRDELKLRWKDIQSEINKASAKSEKDNKK